MEAWDTWSLGRNKVRDREREGCSGCCETQETSGCLEKEKGHGREKAEGSL